MQIKIFWSYDITEFFDHYLQNELIILLYFLDKNDH